MGEYLKNALFSMRGLSFLKDVELFGNCSSPDEKSSQETSGRYISGLQISHKPESGSGKVFSAFLF
ncbi:MAG: hypothetical protein KDK45_20050, partial [Leptospiraceae bacterium]|nr:hypothetical protein [Leptospiraceae bacterium]